jgi:glycosyltransferase involved in cell wall biosynthesis
MQAMNEVRRAMPSCLIIVENLPVPLDRRTWQEAQELSRAGWQVSVVCPKSSLHPESEEIIDGIFVYRHPMPMEARGRFGFFVEYGTALFYETRLAWKVYARHGIDVVHVCNPPDLLFLVALPFKLLGASFVFDHHDICPELYIAKFHRRGLGYWGTRVCEWLSYRIANLVITANESFKALGSARNGKRADDIVVVHSFPDPVKFSAVATNSDLRVRAPLVIGYVGVIGDQDGVETLIRALAVLRDHHNVRGGFICRIVGDGPSCASVKDTVAHLNLEDCVEFTGFVGGQALLTHLASFDIGIIPDPKNCYTDNITMNKVFEYMFLGKPIVGFQLHETMRLVGECGIFAQEETPEALASAIMALMNDGDLRSRLGEAGRRRAHQVFSWRVDAEKLVGGYERLRPQQSKGRLTDQSSITKSSRPGVPKRHG